jgi:hypothetical protein
MCENWYSLRMMAEMSSSLMSGGQKSSILFVGEDVEAD